MATEREVYQIVLQLKDELTAHLNQVNKSLNNTVKEGNKVTSSLGGIKSGMMSFNKILKTVFMGGTMMYGLRQVTRIMGEMETAFAKANPESQKMAGSMTQFKLAVEASKATFGGFINDIVSPARSVLIATIQDATKAVGELDDESESVGETLGRVGVYAVKVFQTLGRLVYDNYNLMRITARAIWELIVNVGEFIWLPLKKGFLTIIQPIKGAFLEMVNWILRQVTAMVNWIGNALSKISPKLGGGLATFSAGQITMEALAPDNVKLKTWAEMMSGIRDTANEVGDALKDIFNTYVDIWTRAPSDARLLVNPKDAEEIKKYKDELRKWMDEAEKLRHDEWQDIINSSEAGRDLLRLQAEIAKQLAESFRAFGMATLQTTIIGVADALGQAAAGAQTFEESMRSLVQTVIKSLGTFMIQKGLELLPTPAGFALLAAGGLFLIGGGAMGARQSPGIPNPAAMASGGIVTRPTLALLGESGAEAVVPLTNPYRGRAGGAGIGGITINAPNARYLDARTAGQLVRLGLVAMRS